MKRASAFLYLAVLILAFARAGAAEVTSGQWQLHRLQGSGALELQIATERSEVTHGAWNSTHDVTANELGLRDAQIDGAPANVAFALHREAGDFTFTGILGEGKGTGDVRFTPSAAFVAALARRHLTAGRTNDLMAAAFLNLTIAYIDDIRANGFADLPFDRILGFRALGVTRDSIVAQRRLFGTLTAQDVEGLTALHVTPEYVAQLRAMGVTDITPRSAVEYKALDITPQYVAELARLGFSKLTQRQVVEFKAMHIDAEYLKHLAAHGLRNLTPEQVVQLKASGI